MQWIKDEFFTKVFVKFLLAGGFAAGVNFFSRMGFSLVVSYPVAIFLAFWIALTTAFVLNRWFVFEHGIRGNAKTQFLFFLLINLLALAQTLMVSLALAWYLLPAMGMTTWVEEIAHFIGIAIPIFTSFVGHKYFSFKNSDAASENNI